MVVGHGCALYFQTNAEGLVTKLLRGKVNEIKQHEKSLMRKERQMKAVYALQQAARSYSYGNGKSKCGKTDYNSSSSSTINSS